MAKAPGKVLRGISRHRSYTVHEVALALGVSRGTVGRWLNAGLPAIKDRKPYLILGEELIAFRGQRKAQKQTCALVECFCFRCRKPRAADGNLADLRIANGKTGNLQMLCVCCGNVMHKRVSLARLPELQARLDVSIRQAALRIAE